MSAKILALIGVALMASGGTLIGHRLGGDETLSVLYVATFAAGIVMICTAPLNELRARVAALEAKIQARTTNTA